MGKEQELRVIYRRCDVSNNRLGDTLSEDEFVQLILTREKMSNLQTEIKIHDEYWHSQRLVEESGIGPLALANKEATELQLRALQSLPNTTKEG